MNLFHLFAFSLSFCYLPMTPLFSFSFILSLYDLYFSYLHTGYAYFFFLKKKYINKIKQHMTQSFQSHSIFVAR